MITNKNLLNRSHQEDKFIIFTNADWYGKDMSYEKNQSSTAVDPRGQKKEKARNIMEKSSWNWVESSAPYLGIITCN